MDPSILRDLFITGVLRGGLYALMAAGLALTFGVMNICNFVHGEYYVLGAYLAYFAFVSFGLEPLLAIAVAALGAFLAGVVTEKGLLLPLRRRSKDEWIMNTFLLTAGLSVALQSIYKLVWGVRYKGITQYWEERVQIGPGMAVAADRLVAFAIAIVAIVLFWLFLKQTNLGRAIRAVSQDENGAKLVGINLDQIHTLAFALGCMLAGLGGASLLSLTPAYPYAGVRPLIRSWFVVTIMGLGSVGGSIVGGFLVGILESVSYYLLGQGWQEVASLLVLILLLLVKPSGLFGSQVKGTLER
jgi:branched-chain amino acid transport system permease protein